MFEFSLCDSDQCSEKMNCMRYLIEEKYCYNAVKFHLANYQCTNKNHYNLKIFSTCDIPVLKGGENLSGENNNS